MNALIERFDVVVVGSGPAGQGAAIQAAQLGARVAVIESGVPGGRSILTDLIPAHTLRAAIDDVVSGAAAVGGSRRRPNAEQLLDDLMWRAHAVIEQESCAVLDRFRRRGIRVIAGGARFVDPNVLSVHGPDGVQQVRSERIVLAVGTLPCRPASIEFDGRTVVTVDEIGNLRRVPERLVVVGAGRVGLEYASMLALLGTQVTVVDRLRRPMRRIDDELADELAYCLRGSGVSLKFGRAVIAIRCTPDGPRVLLDGGEKEHVDAVLVAAGRRPDLDQIQVDAAGLDVEQLQLMDGLIRTQQEHILVVGDAAGAAGTTPAAVEQGRHAALVALGRRLPHPQSMPYVLYTTPELSFVGATEQELRLAGTPYVAGVALYRDLLRGAVAGDSFGRLKLLVHSETRAILGVHVLGRSAAELVHIGQTAMAGGLRLDFFSQAAFNYPTFSTAYTEAALDAAMKLPQRRAK